MKTSNQEKWLKSISWVLIGVIVIVFLVPFLLPEKFCFVPHDYAAFVGGLAGPLASLVGFIYVYLTFLGQQRQLDDQRERLDREDASKEFAEYLNLWIEYRSNISYLGNKGSEAIKKYWENVKGSVIADAKNQEFNLELPADFKSSLTHHFTTSSFNSKSGHYDEFKRMVYSLIEIAESYNLKNRLRFLETLLTDSEKAILIYSATFIDENQSAIRLFKSGFCKSISDEYLISNDHRNLIF